MVIFLTLISGQRDKIKDKGEFKITLKGLGRNTFIYYAGCFI